MVELLNFIKEKSTSLFNNAEDITIDNVEEALLFLSSIGALRLDGGFMILYNAMNIERLKDRKSLFRQDDYRMLDAFYKQKIQQIHIVGEYANLMVKDYNAAIQYVQDYFKMDYKKFIDKYFKGEKRENIKVNLTHRKFKEIFGQLSKRQMDIINDKKSGCIVVAAGPGSGKTRVLVHKLASLILLEDVKHEQLLMLTFSRAAATEFKQRLIGLIGNAAHFVEIKTFHSYCFDLVGRIGNLEDASSIVRQAANMISSGDVEPSKIRKAVLVIDEAQDMSNDEFALLEALIDYNEEMRVIAVGDDDQNIFSFRGSDSRHLLALAQRPGSRLIEMNENYRSCRHLVEFANSFASTIRQRIKSNPIISKIDSDGKVELVTHSSRFIYEPLVEHLIENAHQGSCCVLTTTNEEAAITTALLRQRGVNASLLQSLESFKFYNIVEVRYFISYLERRLSTPLISDSLWQEAKDATAARYATSTNLPYLNRCVEIFETTNAVRYMADFREFVFESSLEDFCAIDSSTVLVSTIHKAKGREFDNVYMLVSVNTHIDDEARRRLYVGITRAKKHLYIHYVGNIFPKTAVDRYTEDFKSYDMPQTVVLQLSHKDVFLDFFRSCKQEVMQLRAGEELVYSNFYFFDKARRPVAKLSRKMQQTLEQWERRNYKVVQGSVRFIVAWRSKTQARNSEESAILLPNLILSNRAEQ